MDRLASASLYLAQWSSGEHGSSADGRLDQRLLRKVKVLLPSHQCQVLTDHDLIDPNPDTASATADWLHTPGGAPVDEQRCAGDVAGRLRAQERGRGRELLDGPEPAGGDVGKPLRAVGADRPGPVGGDHAWERAVDRHSVRR